VRTLFWLVLVCLIVAGVVVGQDQANHDYAGLELDAAGQTEFVSDLRIDAPSLLSDEELGRAADQAAVSMLKDLSGKADSVEGKEIRYSVVDTHNVPPHILRVVEETKTHPTTMVFEGDSGTQYVYIALGERMTGGYLISVESVEQVGERVIVRYNEISPGEDDIVTLAITYPWIVLKVQSDLPIDVVTPDASLGNASSGEAPHN